MNELFNYIDFETISTCNRTCPTCLRNSYPDREKAHSWFERNYLPIDLILKALDQCKKLGFHGGVCLSHYNEPLMDERIVEIAKKVRAYDFHPLFMMTNGDFLTEELASGLDGVLDRITVTLYMEEPMKSKRAAMLKSYFHITSADAIIQSDHIATHFSPKFDVKALADAHRDNPCLEPYMRVIINHQGKYLLCCDDFVGHFGLGSFPKISIKAHWFGKRRQEIMKTLENRGGRRLYSYCSACPRT